MVTDVANRAGTTTRVHVRHRVTPSPLVAAGVFLAYILLVNGIQFASGVPYSEFFASAGNAMKSAVASLAAGGALLLAFSAWSRWDALWKDATRHPMSRLMWLAPVVMVVLMIARMAWKLSQPIAFDLIGAIVLAGIGVGLAEELLFRGIVLRSFRTGTRTEARAMLYTSVWFGCMHLINFFLGTPWYAALMQAFIASVSGATLYLFRRSTGLIVAGMVIHGLWDISTFLPAPETTAFAGFELSGLVLSVVVGLVSAVAALRHDRTRAATDFLAQRV